MCFFLEKYSERNESEVTFESRLETVEKSSCERSDDVKQKQRASVRCVTTVVNGTMLRSRSIHRTPRAVTTMPTKYERMQPTNKRGRAIRSRQM